MTTLPPWPKAKNFESAASSFKKGGSPPPREGPVKWRFAAACNLLGRFGSLRNELFVMCDFKVASTCPIKARELKRLRVACQSGLLIRVA